MRLFRSLPLGLILIITDASLSSANVVPRAIDRLRDVAHRQTKRFAHDLRVAFGAVLVTQPDTPNSRVVYCKSGSPSSIGAGGGGSGNGTSRSPLPSGTTTSTSVKSSSSPVPSSPWKLLDSHVSLKYSIVWYSGRFACTGREQLFRWLVILHFSRSYSWYVCVNINDPLVPLADSSE